VRQGSRRAVWRQVAGKMVQQRNSSSTQCGATQKPETRQQQETGKRNVPSQNGRMRGSGRRRRQAEWQGAECRCYGAAGDSGRTAAAQAGEKQVARSGRRVMTGATVAEQAVQVI